MTAPLVVLAADPVVVGYARELAAGLGPGFRVAAPEGDRAFDAGPLAAAAAEADFIVARELSAPVARAASRCRLVQAWIAGADRFDLAAMREAGLALAAAHENATAVAEQALALVLALGRHVVLGDRALRAGRWSVGFAGGAPPHRQVSGRTVVVVGYGSIGRAFGRLARGFGFHLVGVRRHPGRPRPLDDSAAEVVGADRLDEALGRADVVLLALPKTAETTGLIDARRLAAMRPSAVVVQVGRSETVDERALFEACRDRRIAGAGIDVWWRYPEARLYGAEAVCPPSRFPFHELDNVVLTPHSSGWTEEARAAQIAFVADNIRRAARGERPDGLVDLELGY